MQLIFLNEQDFSVLDYGYATDDFDIILDALVPQKSKFTVNKRSLNAKVGDLLLVKENGYPYVGIITSIKSDDKNQTKVESLSESANFAHLAWKKHLGNVQLLSLNI